MGAPLFYAHEHDTSATRQTEQSRVRRKKKKKASGVVTSSLPTYLVFTPPSLDPTAPSGHDPGVGRAIMAGQPSPRRHCSGVGVHRQNPQKTPRSRPDAPFCVHAGRSTSQAGREIGSPLACMCGGQKKKVTSQKRLDHNSPATFRACPRGTIIRVVGFRPGRHGHE